MRTPYPLEKLPAHIQEEVHLALLGPTAPPKWKIFGDGDGRVLAQIESRAYYEWRRAHPKHQERVLSDIPRHIRGRERARVDRGWIISRDGMVCGICGLAVATVADVEIDHIVPVARGGKSTDDNLRVTHRVCNRQKGARL